MILQVRSVLCFFLGINFYCQLECQVDFIWQDHKAVAVRFSALTDFESRNGHITLEGSQFPIFGRWSRNENAFVFHPAIPFRQKQNYLLRSKGKILLEFSLPVLDSPQTKIVQIYPTVDTVPENILKIHIQFSEPMGERYSEEFLAVTNESGDTLRNIILPLQPELWNKTHDRLTLWFNPGRIKRSLGPNLEMGSPLMSGHHYTLHISKDWRDRNNRTMQNGKIKRFSVGEAIRHRLDPEDWDLLTPAAFTSDDLIVIFGRELDQVLSLECLSVLDQGEQPVEGRVSVTRKESQWHFKPVEQWAKGRYILRIESRLEDLAGNNICRPFDQEVDGDQVESEKIYHDLLFTIK